MTAAQGPGIVISLDLEGYWGVRGAVPPGDFPRAESWRQAVMFIRDELVDRNLHATWATVGLLHCHDRDDALESVRSATQATQEALADSSVASAEPGSLFAPDLVKHIARSRGQELASHTMSHLVASSEVTARAFGADIQAHIQVAKRDGIELRSFVFARNVIRSDLFPVLQSSGIEAIRTNRQDWISRRVAQPRPGLGRRALQFLDDYVPLANRLAGGPLSTGLGLHQSEATSFVRFGSHPFVNRMHLKRLKGLMEQSTRSNRPMHIWWHPHNVATAGPEGHRFLTDVLDLISASIEAIGPSKNMGESCRAV